MPFLSAPKDGIPLYINMDHIVHFEIIPSEAQTLVKIMTTRKESDIEFECDSVETAQNFINDMMNYSEKSKGNIVELSATGSRIGKDDKPSSGGNTGTMIYQKF